MGFVLDFHLCCGPGSSTRTNIHPCGISRVAAYVKTWSTAVGLALTVLLSLPFASMPARAGGSSPVTPLFDRQLTGGKILHSSPVLADLDPGNGNGVEIVIGTLKTSSSEGNHPATLAAVRADGTVWWEQTQVAGGSALGSINSTPAVGDIDGDGQPEIVVGMGGENYPRTHGGIAAFEADGTPKWYRETLDRTSPTGGSDGYADGVFASPSIADFNNDGENDVVVGAWDVRMYVLKGSDGTPLTEGNPDYDWPAEMLDTIWSSPAIANLDGDASLDFVFGGDMSSGSACMDDGGMLRAMRYDITFLPGFDTLHGCPSVGSTRSGHYGIRTEQCLYSSPAIADLDKDDKLEVVIGSGVCYSGGNWVKVWDSDGNLERTFSTDNSVFTSPALADLNGDGYLDIVAGTESGTVYAWDYYSNTTLWSVKPKTCSGTWGMLIRSSPAVADIDGAHAGPEIVIGYDAEVTVLSADGQQLTADSWSDPRPTLWVGISPVWSSPAVGDINGDDQLEIIVGGSTSTDYYGHVLAWQWPNNPVSAPTAEPPWPMFRRNALHWASVLAPTLYVSKVYLPLIVKSH